MSHLEEADHPLLPHFGLHGLLLLGESCPREGQVDIGQSLQVRLDLGRPFRGPGREIAQHALHLALDVEFHALVVVVDLDQRFRFHEDRGSGARGVVDDALELATRLGAHR